MLGKKNKDVHGHKLVDIGALFSMYSYMLPPFPYTCHL